MEPAGPSDIGGNAERVAVRGAEPSKINTREREELGVDSLGVRKGIKLRDASVRRGKGSVLESRYSPIGTLR